MNNRARTRDESDDTDAVTLAVSPEKVCFIIFKAKEFDAKDAVT